MIGALKFPHGIFLSHVAMAAAAPVTPVEFSFEFRGTTIDGRIVRSESAMLRK